MDEFVAEKLAETRDIPGGRGVGGHNPQHATGLNIVNTVMQHHDWFRAEQAPGIQLCIVFDYSHYISCH